MHGKTKVSVLLVFALILSIVPYMVLKAKAMNPKKPAFDLVLEDGTILDGSGKPRYQGDIGIRNGYIAEIGDLGKAEAHRRINVKGLMVAPGFIDVHSHADPYALPQAKSSLTQGVTTEILNPDGFGNADIDDTLQVEKEGLGINIGAYIGFNAVWKKVVGESERRPTDEEIKAMRNLVEQGMKKGAWGVSAGLFYTPANYAKTDEVIQVVEVARNWRTNFPTHIRNENNQVVEATEEVIHIGEEAGLVPVITHMKVMGPNNWGKSKETVGLIQEANNRGTYTAADVYPYLASQTGLTAIVPSWVKDGGEKAMLERFKDPSLRPKIANEIEELIQNRVQGTQDVYLPTKRKTLADMAEEMGVGAGEATIRILETDGDIRTIYHFGNEEDLKCILLNPPTAVASDGGSTESNDTHPRQYGTQPRVLGHFVREKGYLSLEDAVMKMAGLPATMIGMVDRGFIAEGMAADITVFDSEKIMDRATFDNPKQYAEGIEYVIVNGRIALEKGEVKNANAGKALRRSGHMPSRPMSQDKNLQIKGKGWTVNDQGDALMVDFKAMQSTEGTKSKGYLKLDGKALTLKSTQLGMLQGTEDWASFTGRGIVNGKEKTFVVILDQKDPLAKGNPTTLIVYADGEKIWSGKLVRK